MICHILSSRVEYSEQVGFDSNGSSVIVDNSDNAQIYSEEDIFTGKLEPILHILVATIYVKVIIKKGIGTVSWYWTDD